MKIGRNAPCPCGSGKKYKRCCLSASQAVSDEFRDSLLSQSYDSIEEMQAAGDMIMAQQNQRPQDDFLGLSSEQAHRMLHFPYDTPALFQFPEQLSIEPCAPILMLIEGIAQAIDEKGLLATKARGALPQKLCRALWDDYSKLHVDEIFASVHSVNKEDDFYDLNVARIVMELAGLLRKTKGRFYLTQKYKKIINESGKKGLYPIIFKIYCSEFNWAYGDRYNEVSFIQQSFLFTLYMLRQHGDKMALTSVYEDDFLQAFPMMIDEMEESPYSTPEEDFRRCYTLRACRGFLVFLGLAELEKIEGDKVYEQKYKIKKTALLDEVIHFELGKVNLPENSVCH